MNQNQENTLKADSPQSSPVANGYRKYAAAAKPEFNRQLHPASYRPPVAITSSSSSSNVGGMTSSFKTQEELNMVKTQLAKYESEQLKEKFKLNSCYSSLERHSIK